MNIERGDLLSFNGKKYITLEKLMHNGNVYVFVNEVTDNDDILNNYFVFEITSDSIIIVNNTDLLNVLLSKFEHLLKEDIKELFS